MDEKGKGNGLNLDFKIDPEDIINRPGRRREYEVVNSEVPLWVHIMLGIVAGSILIAVLWTGYWKYQAYQLHQHIKRADERQQTELMIMREQRNLRQQAIVQEQQRQERTRQMATPQCRFWTDHYRNNPDQKSLENMRRYCP
ncbi:hypothetical protein [Nitrincola sp.]|uniref:hypothetical protein n=1 Tax=Nitrincola sp. TaxID=1926584 RepID=UPI003A8E01B0